MISTLGPSSGRKDRVQDQQLFNLQSLVQDIQVSNEIDSASLATMNNAVAQLQQQMIGVETSLTDQTTAIDALENLTLNLSGTSSMHTDQIAMLTSATTAITNVNTTQSNDIAAAAARLTTLEAAGPYALASALTTTNSTVSNLSGRVTALESTTASHTSTLNSNSTTLTSHTSTLNSHASTLNSYAAALNSHTASIGALETTVAEHSIAVDAVSEAVGALFVANDESVTLNTTQDNRLAALEAAGPYALASALATTNTTVAQQATGLTTLSQLYVNMQTTVTGIEALDVTQNTRLTSLETTVATLGGGGGSYATTAALATTNSNVAANTSAITALQNAGPYALASGLSSTNSTLSTTNATVSALGLTVAGISTDVNIIGTKANRIEADLLKAIQLLRADMYMSAFMKQLEGPINLKSFRITTGNTSIANGNYLVLTMQERTDATAVIYAPLALTLDPAQSGNNIFLAASSQNIAIRAPVEIQTILDNYVASRGVNIFSWQSPAINTSIGQLNSALRFRDSTTPLADHNLYNCMYMTVSGFYRMTFFLPNANMGWVVKVRQHSATYVLGESITGAQTIGEHWVRGSGATGTFTDVVVPFTSTLFKAFSGTSTTPNTMYLSISVQNVSGSFIGAPQTQTYDMASAPAHISLQTTLKFIPTRYTWDAANITAADNWFGSDNAL